MDMRKLVGNNLKRVRLEKGLTQEELADVSGFTQQYLSTVENGHANPTIITIYEIATSMGAHYLDLLRPPSRQSRR
jgi:transcriptional regulator with XRE-family HTH domain